MEADTLLEGVIEIPYLEVEVVWDIILVWVVDWVQD